VTGSIATQPKVFLINLDRASDRLAFVDQQFRKLGIEYERVPAVDSADLENGPVINKILGRAFKIQPLKPVEAAILHSHRLIWQKILDEDLDGAFVFEDDVHLSMHLTPNLLNQMAAVGFELLRLETTGRKLVLGPTTTLPCGFVARQLHSWHGGSAAYWASRHAAKTLLLIEQTYADTSDQFLFHPAYVRIHHLSVCQLIPAVAIQDEQLVRANKTSPAFKTSVNRRVGRPRSFRIGAAKLISKVTERIRRLAAILKFKSYESVPWQQY